MGGGSCGKRTFQWMNTVAAGRLSGPDVPTSCDIINNINMSDYLEASAYIKWDLFFLKSIATISIVIGIGMENFILYTTKGFEIMKINFMITLE